MRETYCKGRPTLGKNSVRIGTLHLRDATAMMGRTCSAARSSSARASSALAAALFRTFFSTLISPKVIG